MAYDGQLSRNDPFEFYFPEVLLPFGLRMVSRLRRMFEKINWSSKDIHRMAQGLDERLEQYAQQILDQPDLRQKLTEGLFSQDDRPLLLGAMTTQQVRYAATDRVLLTAMRIDVRDLQHLHPDGSRPLSSTEFDATLAMWKMVDAIELLSAGRPSVKRLSQAHRFAMEAMESGNAAFTMEMVVIASDILHESSERARVMTGDQIFDLVVGAFKKDASERSRKAANARGRRYNPLKKEVLRLVEVGGYTKQYAAAQDIATIINGKDASVPDKIKESTVKTYLREAGWTFAAEK